MSQGPEETPNAKDARIVIDLDSKHPILQPVLARLNPLLQEILNAMKTTSESVESVEPYEQPSQPTGVFHRVMFSSCCDF